MTNFDSLSFPSGRTVGNCRKDAKRLAKQKQIPLHKAQDIVAAENGSSHSWGHAIALLKTQPQPVLPSRSASLMSQADIRAVMVSHPNLTHFGIGIFRLPRQSVEERRVVFERERGSLAGALDECNRAMRFLMHALKRKTINARHSSYGLKHMTEDFMGRLPDVSNTYVANGAFICAAIHLGFDVAPAGPDSPNVCFNISDRSPVIEWLHLRDRGCRTAKSRAKLAALERELGVVSSAK
ncbi:MAG TPA: hypothetical protein PKD55_26435 [Bellilinea sp.]|nr:hypothetical protein [Bellilinea sp.]